MSRSCSSCLTRLRSSRSSSRSASVSPSSRSRRSSWSRLIQLRSNCCDTPRLPSGRCRYPKADGRSIRCSACPRSQTAWPKRWFGSRTGSAVTTLLSVARVRWPRRRAPVWSGRRTAPLLNAFKLAPGDPKCRRYSPPREPQTTRTAHDVRTLPRSKVASTRAQSPAPSSQVGMPQRALGQPQLWLFAAVSAVALKEAGAWSTAARRNGDTCADSAGRGR